MDTSTNKNQGCQTSIGEVIGSDRSGSRVIFWDLFMCEESLIEYDVIRQVSQSWVERPVQVVLMMALDEATVHPDVKT